MTDVYISDQVDIKIEVGTLATLIAGMYSTFASIDPLAIPSSVYIELCEKLVPYLENWDYEKWSFEQWIKNSLLIVPKDFFSEEELKQSMNNEIYFERANGRVILVVTAEV